MSPEHPKAKRRRQKPTPPLVPAGPLTAGLSANFAENPDTLIRRRGRPRDPIRSAVLRVFPEVRSERGICDKVAATKVAIAIGTIDPGLHEWLYSRRETVVYALGRLPQGVILEIGRQLREEGVMTAGRAVRIIRYIGESLKAGDSQFTRQTDSA